MVPGASLPIRVFSVMDAGRVKQHKTLAVKIPAGVDEGDRIRLSGEGEHGINGGPSGDLYVQIHLKTTPCLSARTERSALRDADQLHDRGPWVAKSIFRRSTAPAKDPGSPETQSGKIFRLRGKGIKGVRSQRSR
jgi:molecular chaperone DnaJ